MLGSFLNTLEGKFMMLGFSRYDAKMIAQDIKQNRLNPNILLSTVRGLGWDIIMDRENNWITLVRYNDVLRVKYKGEYIDWNTLKVLF